MAASLCKRMETCSSSVRGRVRVRVRMEACSSSVRGGKIHSFNCQKNDASVLKHAVGFHACDFTKSIKLAGTYSVLW